MRILPSLLLVCALGGGALAEDDERFGSARDLEVPTLTAPAPGDQMVLAVSSGEHGYLAVWHDRRVPAWDVPPVLRAVLVDEGGASLGPRGIRLPAVPPAIDLDATAARHVADVAAGDGLYLVVWQDTRVPASVRMARVASNGWLLDPTGIVLANGGREPTVTWDGAQFLVSWVADGAAIAPRGGALRIARVRTDGRVLDKGGEVVVPSGVSAPSIASDGRDAMLVWTQEPYAFAPEYRSVRSAFVRISDRGLLVKNRLVAGGLTDQWEPDVTADGDGYAVVWQGGGAIRLARLRWNGEVEETVHLATLDGPVAAAVPTVSRHDGRILVSWIAGPRTGRVLWSTFADGAAGAAPFEVASRALTLAATSDGAASLVAWTAWSDVTRADVLGAVVVDPKPIAQVIATAPAWQIEATVSGQRDLYLAAWSTWGSIATGADLHGAIVDGDGEIVVPAFVIAAGEEADHSPVAAPSYDGWVVAWRRGMDVVVTHVDEDGLTRPVETIGATIGESELALVRGHGGMLIAWTVGDRMRGRMLDQLGRPTGAELDLGTCAGPCREPRIAWAHASYLVTWWSEADDAGTERIGSVRVADGRPIARPFDLVGTRPSLAPRGMGFLLVYAVPAGIVAVPLDRIGQPSGDVVLFAPATWPDATQLVAVGDTYLAAWTEDGVTTVADLDARGRHVDGSAESEIADASFAALAADGDAALIVTETWDNRISARSVKVTPAPDEVVSLEGGCGCRGSLDELGMTVLLLVALLILWVPRRRPRC